MTSRRCWGRRFWPGSGPTSPPRPTPRRSTRPCRGPPWPSAEQRSSASSKRLALEHAWGGMFARPLHAGRWCVVAVAQKGAVRGCATHVFSGSLHLSTRRALTVGSTNRPNLAFFLFLLTMCACCCCCCRLPLPLLLPSVARVAAAWVRRRRIRWRRRRDAEPAGARVPPRGAAGSRAHETHTAAETGTSMKSIITSVYLIVRFCACVCMCVRCRTSSGPHPNSSLLTPPKPRPRPRLRRWQQQRRQQSRRWRWRRKMLPRRRKRRLRLQRCCPHCQHRQHRHLQHHRHRRHR